MRNPTTAPDVESRVLALLPEEPAGKISTRNAGSLFFEATFSWRPEDELPPGPVLSEPATGTWFYSLATSETATMRRISCEIRALHPGPLSRALDAALRSVTDHAALTEATLETRAIRLLEPSAPPAALVEELARQLWNANLPVSFGPSWTPVPVGADISVGVLGLQRAFEAFLQKCPAWRTLPR